MDKAPICLIINPKVPQRSLRAVVPWNHCARLLLFWHVCFNQHGPDWKNINFVLVLHFDCPWKEIVVHLCCRIVWYIRNRMLCRKWWYVHDCTPLLSFKHPANHVMTHHCHWHDVHIDFVHDPLVSNFMKKSDVGNSDIIHHYWNVHSLQFLKDFCEKIRVLALSEICYNALRLNRYFVIQVLNFL